MSHLFVCATPLQTVISQKIIKMECIINFDFVFLSRNGRNDYRYFAEISHQATESYFLTLKKGNIKFSLLSKFESLIGHIKLYLLSKKLRLKYDSIYGDAISNGFVKTLFSYLKHESLYTIDDGCGNINLEGIELDTPKYVKILLRFFGINKDIDLLHCSKVAHYTIFKNNNISNSILIQLFEQVDTDFFEPKSGPLNMFIGSPFTEDGITSKQCECELINKTVEKYNITVYLQHPRENRNKSSNIRIIKPEIIAEHYILNLLQDYEFVNLYGIASTVLINMMDIENINSYVLIDKLIPSLLTNHQNIILNSGVEPVFLD